MKLVVQRVSRARVVVDGRTVGRINQGLLVLVGCERGDTCAQAEKAAQRVATLRVFTDDQGKMNRGLDEVAGSVLVVSQFTLAGSIRKGRRPSFDRAMPAGQAEELVEVFVTSLRERGVAVETGVFGAEMEVELTNLGPVTLLWEDEPEQT